MFTYVNTPFGLAVQNAPKYLIQRMLTYVNLRALHSSHLGVMCQAILPTRSGESLHLPGRPKPNIAVTSRKVAFIR
jgi:hypothetical protein